MKEKEVKMEVKKGCGSEKQAFKKKGSGGEKPGQNHNYPMSMIILTGTVSS